MNGPKGHLCESQPRDSSETALTVQQERETTARRRQRTHHLRSRSSRQISVHPVAKSRTQTTRRTAMARGIELRWKERRAKGSIDRLVSLHFKTLLTYHETALEKKPTRRSRRPWRAETSESNRSTLAFTACVLQYYAHRNMALSEYGEPLAAGPNASDFGCFHVDMGVVQEVPGCCCEDPVGTFCARGPRRTRPKNGVVHSPGLNTVGD